MRSINIKLELSTVKSIVLSARIGIIILSALSSCSAFVRQRLSLNMGNSFRPQPGPAVYGENKTPVTSDLLQVGLLVAFAMIAFSFLLILPGIRGSEVCSVHYCILNRHHYYNNYTPGVQLFS